MNAEWRGIVRQQLLLGGGMLIGLCGLYLMVLGLYRIYYAHYFTGPPIFIAGVLVGFTGWMISEWDSLDSE